jgi:hypothetical protein
MGTREVRWDIGGNEPAGKYTFFYRKWSQNNELGTGTALKRVEFFSDKLHT